MMDQTYDYDNPKIRLLKSYQDVEAKERSHSTRRLLLLTVTSAAALALGVVLLMLLGVILPTYTLLHDVEAPVKTFKAAVYEQKLVHAKNAITREEALVAIQANLKNQEQQAQIASSEGVNIIVFAEYGITGYMEGRLYERKSVYPYMEEIPDISTKNPACVSCEKIAQGKEGQSAIGCMASKYNMYIVANLIESVPCKGDQECPSDGHYQYNTNIVYDRNGCLIAKYHKYHRYGEEFQRLDRPAQPEYVFFDTEYGRFGTMICMDSWFKRPAISLVEKYKIDHMLFPTAWDNNNENLYTQPLQWQLAFASRLNVNFLGANVHSIKNKEFGSGIISGQKVVNFTANYKTDVGTLLTGLLPVKVDKKEGTVNNFVNSKTHEKTNAKKMTVDLYNDTYNAAILQGFSGRVEVCYQSLCCSLEYVRNSTKETYVLGALKGQHHKDGNITFDNCVVDRCKGSDLSSCGRKVYTGETSFSNFMLSGTFRVKYVYPSILPSDLQFKNIDWSFQQSTSTRPNMLLSSSDWPLVAAGLIGRDFKHDHQI